MSTDRSEPDVSVLTPSYGYGRFISDALESVQGQEGTSVEHIVQDAASRDDTIEILRTFGDRVRWRSEPDEGQSDALNRAIGSAKGRWIAWLNADEFYFPGGLRTLISAGEEAGADVVFGDAIFVDEDGKLIRLFPQHRYSSLLLRHYGVYIASCATVFRRSVLGSKPWDADIRRVMDWDLYLRLDAQGARFLHVPFPVGGYRIHDAQITAQPAEHYAADLQAVRGRYGIPERRWKQPARLMHAVYKLFAGAYGKQFTASRLRGSDMRWCRPEVGAEGFLEVLMSCYGDRE
jgi:glycosyltransferase involved in cell wall biosynthesis